MQIRFSRLKDKLAKSSVFPLLVSGDEPYQHMLACDMFRARAKQLEFSERKILTVETGFDWSELEHEQSNMSLFGERILIDLRIPNGKPGAAGSKAIVNFVENLHDDVTLLIQAPRLDRNGINSAWVKAIDNVGGVLRVWPLNEMETRNWIQQKLRAKGLTATTDVVGYITQQVEGNLLAAMQEIEKIALVSKSKDLDLKNIHALLTNSSHYSLNELMDVVLKGDVARVIRIIAGLKKEDVAPPLLLWGLTEQVRKLVDSKPNGSAAKNDAQHDILHTLCKLHQKSTDICQQDLSSKTSDLLKQCARVDRVIKGRAFGDPWHELLQLSIAIRYSV
ncbi:MAG: DNA polymerase III subunit delta [Gammaproteobacteria bacterium]|nr:DNA polymerase III subunit delta [Gammaproteobacteria bacterium]NNC67768.1 DNA polymerase III subunit delta [Gammaproteobacteria bacterium]